MIDDEQMTNPAPATDIQPTSREAFRNGMARLASAVNLITTDGPAGLAGLTATAVSSVTDEPPTLLVCLNRASNSYPLIAENRVLAVNTLGSQHVALSRLFASKSPIAERFAAGVWQTGMTGAPMLIGALVTFDCRVAHVLDVGTHAVLICAVVGVSVTDATGGLVYFDRDYRGVGPVPHDG